METKTKRQITGEISFRTPAVAIRTIETTGSEPNLPERDTNVPEKDPPVLKEKLARPVVGKIPVRPTEDVVDCI